MAAPPVSAPVDMSTKVGGRVFTPAFPVVDGAPSQGTELAFDATLQAHCAAHIPLEATSGIATRERVLQHMGRLCREWIQHCCVAQGLPVDVTHNAGGQLFTSGSYRLGVHEPGADIDCILVAPHMCKRGDFFGTAYHDDHDEHARDPHSLAERIRAHPQVTNFVPVEGAAVPILTFDWEGINIDLLFARLNSSSVGADFDIDNDQVLDGADSATEKSLNGPRVTNLIAALMSGTPVRYQTFLQVVRCVRQWAKSRGLYSNKMGYWGGVNMNLGVALTVQLYPNVCAATLLRKFFLLFKTWRWPQPVLLCKSHDAGYGLPVWSPQTAARQVAPMITPAYPAMNSTLAISRQTLQILQEEFQRGHEIVDKLWKTFQTNPSSVDAVHWAKLFAPSDFFIAYPNYLSLCIVGPSQAEAQAWAGFVESRLRKLVSDLLARSLPLKKIQLWPKKLEVCVADRGALLTQAQRQNCITYFIGFHVDKSRMRGETLNVEVPLANFRDWELGRFQPLINGMDVLAKTFKVKELPKICFESYEGGKLEAMKKRRYLLDTDPKRQEKKRLAKLEELKLKMAEIQRKKEEDKERKRKREEIELEEEALAKVVKEEESSGNAEAEAAESEDLDALETALDTMVEEAGAHKTREEAEADRQRLLAGEMIADEGDGEVESDDEAAAYTLDGARLSIYKRQDQKKHKDMRSLPPTDENADLIRKLGFNLVSDDEAIQLGAEFTMPKKPEFRPVKFTMSFREKFDIVELDAHGHVIDMGDDDFTPSKSWIGRKAGFEFKLGERGMGYYRTGKKVVVPSNTAY